MVIPLLQGPAKKGYQSIHPYISEEGALREGIPFDPKNVLRTWEGFWQRLVSSFGGHSDLDHPLRQWNDLTMKPGKSDHFCDELIRLALELGYSVNFVKDKARVGITTDLGNARALKTPLPDEYVEYINLLRQTGHQLEDLASFNRMVTREKHHSKREQSDDRNQPLRDSERIGNARGHANRNPATMRLGLQDLKKKSTRRSTVIYLRL